MNAKIVVARHGGAETLEYREEAAPPAPGPGEAQIRHEAIGLNFIDIYFRTGLYKPAALPFTPGMEGAGVVEAVGAGVDEVAPGQRVAYAGPIGGYAQRRNAPAARLVPLPDAIDEERAAAMMLKGMTAQYLLKQTKAVQPGEPILFYAAAGGVGAIACQWAKALGAVVIGVVGSDAKAEEARASGCAHVVVRTREDVVARVKDITGGEGVSVVYDSVGADTFEQSLDCLRPRGLMVSFGNASGAVEGFDLGVLNQKGGLFVTRPSLAWYTQGRAGLLEVARDLFAAVESGAVRIPKPRRFALADAAEAHRALESGGTTGAAVLIP